MNEINMRSVESSNVEAVGYDEEHHVLRIKFKRTPTLYDYPNVDKADFDGLLAAESVGKYVSALIKRITGPTKITPSS